MLSNDGLDSAASESDLLKNLIMVMSLQINRWVTINTAPLWSSVFKMNHEILKNMSSSYAASWLLVWKSEQFYHCDCLK